jgi:uncharacterized protein YbcC (UPF0753/DUF2309 family)
MNHSTSIFSEDHVIHELKHYLPTQTPIKDFIHHNTLHAFQHMKFYDAIFRASKMFGYQATLELNDFRGLYEIGRINDAILDKVLTEKKGQGSLATWKNRMLKKEYDQLNVARIGRIRSYWKVGYNIDLDDRVHPLLFRIICSYLDQGISLWHFPKIELGFLEAIKKLEKNSYISFFKSKRAKKMLMEGNYTINGLLDILVGDPKLYDEYLFDQQFAHHGWSGMVSTIEDMPHTLLYTKKISLKEVITFELLLEIDNLDTELGTENWKPLGKMHHIQSGELFSEVPKTEFMEVLQLWQDAFEWSYYDQVLTGLNQLRSNPKEIQSQKSFQAVFCIDERECSLRRHVELFDAQCETLGCPGFFGVEFYFLPENGKFYEKLCPAPVTPKYLIKETDTSEEHKKELLYEKRTHSLFGGFLNSILLGYWAGLRLILDLFRPKMSPAISNAFAHMGKDSVLHIENKDVSDRENGLQLGFTLDEMTDRVEGLLKGIGLVKDFAPVVYLISHGSSSANNPHHGAHDCGACSGRPGATNARVFAFMANHPQVRARLAQRGLYIPDQTQFIGAMHDTASDLMDYYDLHILNDANKEGHGQNWIIFEKALDMNAKERSRRFASINTKDDLKKIRRAIEARSVSLFEPRPELGHGTNALCIVGRRKLTKGLFLDRRAFMNSYDYSIDPEGKLLFNVIKPLPVVCGGINLEYYFSRVDNQKFGAGTKLPHNVMGLIGVANSSDGDLRPGLPLQMIEVHDPVRLLMIVEHFHDVILNTIKSTPELYEWFKNEWVHLMAVNPETGEYHYFSNDAFHPYHTSGSKIPKFTDISDFIEAAKEMETNHILHATQENLPIHIIN